jgi:hypothetical protein
MRMLSGAARRGGRLPVSGDVAIFAKVDKRVCLRVTVAVLAECVQGLLVEGDGLRVLAEEVAGVAEAVRCVGGAVTVAELAESNPVSAFWRQARASW